MLTTHSSRRQAAPSSPGQAGQGVTKAGTRYPPQTHRVNARLRAVTAPETAGGYGEGPKRPDKGGGNRCARARLCVVATWPEGTPRGRDPTVKTETGFEKGTACYQSGGESRPGGRPGPGQCSQGRTRTLREMFRRKNPARRDDLDTKRELRRSDILLKNKNRN